MPETVVVILGNDGQGRPIFSALVKRTYSIRDGGCTLSKDTSPFVRVDDYYDDGDPLIATIKFENELIPYKPATDVVIVGKAYAPDGRPTTEMTVSAEVGDLKKRIAVIGDRYCIFRKRRAPEFSEPARFTEMEIRYERAYGGWDTRSEPNIPFAYPRNPLGTGFAIGNHPDHIEGLRLPNIEDPRDLLTPERLILGDPNRWNRQPLPQGFGWFQRNWYPRCSFAGTLPAFVQPDEVMREETMGLVPKGQIALGLQMKLPSFDVRFNNGASLGMAMPGMSGSEAVRLRNMTPEGELIFDLPGQEPSITLDIGLGGNKLRPHLDTVCIQPDKPQVDMVWRGSHRYPGNDWLPNMKRMDVEVH